jgi:hypothetical protein
VKTFAVRTAMSLCLEHAGEGYPFVIANETVESEYSGDATHGLRKCFSFRS